MVLHPLILLFAVPAAHACPSLDAELERATQALLSGDSHGAAVALTEADAALACAPATPAGAGRYFLVTAAVRHLAGEDAGPLLAAAKRAAPDGFDARLGPELRAAFDRAAPAGDATLLLEPALPGVVDGTPTPTWPATLPAGPHLVQVVGASGDVPFYKSLTLAPGEDALVPTGLAPDLAVGPAAPALPEAAPEPAKPKKSPALLVAAAVAAAGGGACAAGAAMQNPQMESAADPDALDAAFGRQKALAGGAYGLWAVAGVTAVLHFVL